MPLTNILTLSVLIATLFTTNVGMLPLSDGFSEREFKTNIVQTITYEFVVNNKHVKFTESQTNSFIGVYLPIITTNFVPVHYKNGMVVTN